MSVTTGTTCRYHRNLVPVPPERRAGRKTENPTLVNEISDFDRRNSRPVITRRKRSTEPLDVNQKKKSPFAPLRACLRNLRRNTPAALADMAMLTTISIEALRLISNP